MLRHHRQCEACGRVAASRSLPSGWSVIETPRGARADICATCGEFQTMRLLTRPELDALWIEHFTGHVGPA